MGEHGVSDCSTTDRGDERRRVVVVGAGAAGTLSAIALLRQLDSLGTAVEIVVVDPGEPAAGGVAFSTADPAHLLNVRTRDLSAHLDDVGHFTAWTPPTAATDEPATDEPATDEPANDPDGFRPRGVWGAYLRATFEQTIAAAAATGRVSVVSVRGTATSMQALPPPDATHRVVVVLDTGERLVADAVVLALGIESPGIDWAPAGLCASDRFVADPWKPGVLARLAEADGDVLLVGTGLTMVDVALSLARPGRTVHATSRRGLVPAVHATTRIAGVPCGPLVAAIGAQTSIALPMARRLVADHLAAAARRGDWRPAFDGLRPVTALLWQRLSLEDRREFLRTDVARWDTHRHRMPGRTAAALAARRRAGEVVVGRGEVVSVSESETGLHVVLGDGRELDVAHVVNCTGPQADVGRSSNPLVVDLLATGAGAPGPLGIGLASDLAGRLQGTTDGEHPHHWPTWCVGALRRGELWESSAVPEMRSQSASAAAHVVALLRAVDAEEVKRAAPTLRGDPAPRRGTARPEDGHGLPLSTTAEAAAAYNLGLTRVLCVQDGADEAFREAVALDPGFSLGHAALALLGHELGAPGDVQASVAAARATLSRWTTDREHSFVDVVARRVAGPGADGAAALMAHLSAHPRDALAVSAAVPTIAFSGVTDLQQESWALVESLRPAYGDDWWYAGLLAFVRQDQGRYDEADRLAVRALLEVPGSGHAVHAQTHVFYETGQHDAGLSWLDHWISTSGRQASHLAHFSWHAALHELSLGSLEALHRRYDAELAPPHVSGVRALVDSASLLWRCQMTGSWSGDLPLSSVLDTIGPELLERPTTPFTAMHAAVALTAAGDLAALARLRAHAAARHEPVMRDVVVQLCDALAAVAEQRWDDAVRTLRLLGPWLVQLGGSAAQREIVEDTLLFALVRCGRYGEARTLLEARLERRPSPLDRRRLDAVPA